MPTIPEQEIPGGGSPEASRCAENRATSSSDPGTFAGMSRSRADFAGLWGLAVTDWRFVPLSSAVRSPEVEAEAEAEASARAARSSRSHRSRKLRSSSVSCLQECHQGEKETVCGTIKNICLGHSIETNMRPWWCGGHSRRHTLTLHCFVESIVIGGVVQR